MNQLWWDLNNEDASRYWLLIQVPQILAIVSEEGYRLHIISMHTLKKKYNEAQTLNAA